MVSDPVSAAPITLPNQLEFTRTIWSTSDASDEANNCVLWEGSSHRVARFKLELLMDIEALTSMKVTPVVEVSDDGETWTEADWVGEQPSAVTANTLQVIGPLEIDPSHHKRQARICLKTEKASGVGVVYGNVRGKLLLWDAGVPQGSPPPAYKTSDTTWNNDATLADDPHLKRPLAANAAYRFSAFLIIDSPPQADFQVAFTAPTASDLYWTSDADGIGAIRPDAGTSQTFPTGNTYDQSVCVTGTVMTDSTSGYLQLQGAQGSAYASDSTLKAGSWLKVERMDV